MQATLASAESQLATSRAECESARAQVTRLTAEHATANAQIVAAQQALERERAAFEESRRQLKVEFANVASEVAQKTSAALQQEFSERQRLTGETLSQKEEAIDGLLQPVRESLEKLTAHSQTLEVKREGAYAEMQQQIRAMQEAHANLGRETRQLVSALRNPKVRGNWGEMQLRRCIEFAGMVERCDFRPQASTRTEDERLLRPDVVVHLPNHRVVVIDAKTPLDAFLSAMNAPDTAEGDAERKRLLQRHASQLREHLRALDTKNYSRQFAHEGSPELVVCFLPSEVLLYSALEQDPTLLEFSSTVVLATPTTLIALLKAVQCGWQQLEVARNADHIREAALSVYDKLVTATDKIGSLGSSLKNAVGHYNAFLRTVQGRGGVFSLGRKLHELQIGGEELEALPALEVAPELLTHDAWQQNALALQASDDRVVLG